MPKLLSLTSKDGLMHAQQCDPTALSSLTAISKVVCVKIDLVIHVKAIDMTFEMSIKSTILIIEHSNLMRYFIGYV